jgi:flagellar biosynthesis/type III secretory pathway M-ring protein FliF/YscJ
MKLKNSNIVTKIALIVAIVALIFSIITLVRAIIINAGIPLAVVQVIGTAIIVAICSIMLYVLSNNPEDDEDEEEEEKPEDASAEDDEPKTNVEFDEIGDLTDDPYDLKNFE